MDSITGKNLDHLGIVAQICHEIDICKIIDNTISLGSGNKITAGEGVISMILNCLGFVDQPLYLFPEFLATKPIEQLIRPGLQVEWFNETTIGRTLDRVFEAGSESLFTSIAVSAYKKYGLDFPEFVHLDTSSMSVEGEYESDEVALRITHGYSKDGRPDLKQFMIGLVTHGKIPIYIEALNGNTSDRTYFRELALTIGRSIQDQWNTDKVLIFDSAFYSKENIQAVDGEINWITSVPKSIKLVKELLTSIDKSQMEQTTLEGYSLTSQVVEYGNVEQRWIIVYSDKAFQLQEKALIKMIKKEDTKVQNQLWHFSCKTFSSKEDARQALVAITKKWKYHKLGEITFKEQTKRLNGKRGRPRLSEQVKIEYSLEVTYEQDSEAISTILAKKGKFILATSLLDTYSDEEILSAYKSQQNVEQGFRFLKDRLFFAPGIYLKKPSRIKALIMIMGLALLVFNLAESLLRKALEEANEPLPDKYRKPTTTPTIRRVFQIFQGIIIFYGTQTVVVNMQAVHWFVLRHLGVGFVKMYST